MVVVFPAPLRPRKPKILPFGTARFSPHKAGWPWNDLQRPVVFDYEIIHWCLPVTCPCEFPARAGFPPENGRVHSQTPCAFLPR